MKESDVNVAMLIAMGFAWAEGCARPKQEFPSKLFIEKAEEIIETVRDENQNSQPKGDDK